MRYMEDTSVFYVLCLQFYLTFFLSVLLPTHLVIERRRSLHFFHHCTSSVPFETWYLKCMIGLECHKGDRANHMKRNKYFLHLNIDTA